MKPTIVNLIFAGVLFFGKFITKKPLLEKLFQNTLKLENAGWEILSKRWIFFFYFCGNIK